MDTQSEQANTDPSTSSCSFPGIDFYKKTCKNMKAIIRNQHHVMRLTANATLPQIPESFRFEMCKM